MGTAIVAGVEVSTDHWIGGERVASSARFPVVSPIDGTHLADVAAGGAREVDAAVRAARAAFPAWAALGPQGRAPILKQLCRGDPGAREGAGRSRDGRQRLAAPRQRPSHGAARRAQHRVLRRLGSEARAHDRRARGHESRALRARRRRRSHHALECAADAHDLEGGSGARGRQHRRREAAGMGAAHLLVARGHRERGGHSSRRLERGAGHRRGRRRGAGRARGRSTGSASPAHPKRGVSSVWPVRATSSR